MNSMKMLVKTELDGVRTTWLTRKVWHINYSAVQFCFGSFQWHEQIVRLGWCTLLFVVALYLWWSKSPCARIRMPSRHITYIHITYIYIHIHADIHNTSIHVSLSFGFSGLPTLGQLREDQIAVISFAFGIPWNQWLYRGQVMHGHGLRLGVEKCWLDSK